MRVFVGTSGWAYFWNPEGSFDWYVRESGLNSVELNASYYRFPFPSQVKSWAKKTPEWFRWAVKVSRFVTHVFKFNERALSTWQKFRKLFTPLDGKVDFYLFQLPPNMKPTRKSVEKVERFVEEVELGSRFAMEWRNEEWFTDKWVRWARSLNLTLVSVDAPDLPRRIMSVNGRVYLRMHGRTSWYSHVYSRGELEEVAGNIAAEQPESVYVFFNNDTGMIVNGREMLSILKLRFLSH
ncbi:MAG: DUF72 domain-containing protein [Candidatus Freyarchaeota archaeon]|nr:DUF72 domain-containing protein [Candidatus Jordarchaeia archaeon]